MNSNLTSRLRVAIVFALFAWSTEVLSAPDCRDEEEALDFWQPIRQQAETGGQSVNDLALELVSCLGSPNPELRDRIAYELFAKWLREEALSDETRAALLGVLSKQLGNPALDTALSRSFSALILAELMRSDGVAPFMTTVQRQLLLDTAMAALQNEDDFRGLEADVGWIHPIAHMADLHWRFALHPATSGSQATSILEAVRSKVAPTATFYMFNESDRLARVVATIVVRQLVDAESLGAWIAAFQTPQSMNRWSEAFQNPAGMAELHNTKLFLRALSDQLAGGEISAEVAEPLAALVQGFTELI